MLNDTIAAIATGDVDGAVSIVRLSGDRAIEIADTLFSGDLLHAASHTVHHRSGKRGSR